MNSHELRDFVYQQIARIGKAVSSPKRLELLDLLSQGEKTVELMALRSDMSVKLTSAHLKELRHAKLVETRKDGKYVVYSLANEDITALWLRLRALAENQYKEFSNTLNEQGRVVDDTSTLSFDQVFKKAKRGEIVLIDVRPRDEFAAGHFPFAQSIPLEDLKKRLSELPKNKEIITYCRGSHCLQANEAVKILKKRGFKAARLKEGVTDLYAQGLSLEKSTSR